MAMDVTLRQQRAFVAVLEASSFSEAARSMHLSQAALSGMIKELKCRVGVRLLDRSTRSVSPSVVGQAFEPMVRRVLSNLDEALANLTNLKDLRRGLVRVAAPETLSCTLLPELIAGYGRRHPGVGPAGVIADEGLEAHVICADPIWVALRPDDPLANGAAMSWKELRERPLLNYMPNIAVNTSAISPSQMLFQRIAESLSSM